MDSPIKEDLLHYVWRTQRFDHDGLATTDGQSLTIQQYGHLNADAGPDFLEGVITIEDTKWAGQIEMHVRSSDWLRHGHTGDQRYDNVILHVVYEHDVEIKDPAGHNIPVLLMKDRISDHTLKRYEQLQANDAWIPCAALTGTVDPIKWSLWLDSVIAERLSTKATSVHGLVQYYKGDWSSVTFHMLCRAFGLKVNVDAMDALAYIVPLSIVQKNANDSSKVEALLFGQAGLLDLVEEHDEHSQMLSEQYAHLRRKYQLVPVDGNHWRYSRMRPTSFPDLRLAELVAILCETTHLFQYIRENAADAITDLLSQAASSYWDQHYRLAIPSTKDQQKRLGTATIRSVLINAFAPVLMAYGESIAEYGPCEQAIELLYQLPAEKNKVLRQWQAVGIVAEHSAHSQALLHLKKHYCDQQRCLQCSIGAAIVGK